MTQSGKVRVAVLYGGRSVEHEVSLQSAANVIANLDTTRFEVVPIGIDKKGHWYLGHDTFQRSLKHASVTKQLENDPAWFAPDWLVKPCDKPAIHDLIKHASKEPLFDVVFPVVHGTFCEDGSLQGLLETADLPYVGCGVLSSSLNMDKDVSKRLALQAGLRTAPYMTIKYNEWQTNADHLLQKIGKTISIPVFVKPANAGSSVGISKVKHPDKLREAIEDAFRFDTKILIEQALDVLELEVAVLESLTSQDPIVSVVGEIIPSHEFYSYEAKYIDQQGAALSIPARVSQKDQDIARDMAKTLFSVLECEGMARIDLFYNKQDGQIYFNEVNTIPGFTKISMYPKLMDASGMSYSQLLTHLIELALKRHEYKNKLIREYA